MIDDRKSFIDRIQCYVNIVHSPSTGWVILGLSLVLTFFAYWFASSQVESRAREHFTFRSNEISDAVRERLLMYEQALNGAVGLFSVSQHVSRTEWKAYVDSLRLSERLPGIQGMGYAVPLTAAGSEQLVATLRGEGFADFVIKPPGEREEYSAIIYLEPFDWRNQRAFGYDMWSNALRREAMARARDLGVAATSGMITLVQETQNDVQRGFLTYLPVYDTPIALSSVEARREHFRGWVYAAFRAEDLMHGILRESDDEIAFEIYDGTEFNPENLLFDSDGRSSLTGSVPVPLFEYTMQLQLHGRPWSIYFNAPFAEAYQSFDSHQPVFILLAGTVIDTLLFYVLVSLHLVNRHTRKSERELLEKFELNQQSVALQGHLVEMAEKESETFFELAPEALLVVANDGTIVKANHTAHKLFEFESGSLTGVNVEVLVPLAVREQHSSLRKKYSAAPSLRMMGFDSALVAIKQGGEAFSATINLVPIEFRGEMHTVAAVHDVSVQKQIEQTFADANAKAESASRSKSEFVANMSHEIRTPLNAVLGAAQLLDKTKPNAKQQKYIRMIRSSGEALLGIVNDILDFSKIEAGCMELTPVPYDLFEVLARIAVMMSVNAGEKDIELVIIVDPAVNQGVIGDPLRLQQVLINLVSNAIKFTEQGSVVLSIELQELLDSDKQLLCFSVSDTGIGMNSNQTEQLFKVFSQADNSITRRFGGTGLGLVISGKILAMMGSRIQLKSELGKGSTFSFEAIFSSFYDTHRGPKLIDGPGRTILLFEDNLASQKCFANIVDSLGWRLLCVNQIDAIKAIDQDVLRSCDFALFDLALVNNWLDETLTALEHRGLPSGCAKILVLNNNQQAELICDELKAQFSSCIAKPILRNAMLQALDEAAFAIRGEKILLQSQTGPLRRSKFNGIKVLLVEDNVFNQTVIQGLLEDMGVELDIANNGQEAVDTVSQNDERYDLVLMDIQMPVMDGVTATHILRKDKKFIGPIIAMTAGVLQSERERYQSVGMDYWVPKPIDGGELFRAISMALPNRFDDGAADEAEVSVDSVALVEPEDLPVNKVFDGRRLQDLARGKSSRILGIIDSLRAIVVSGQETMVNGVDAVRQQDYDKARFEFHNLKGVFANYGGDELAELIRMLEISLREQRSFDELQGQFNSLESAFWRFVEQSQIWIVEQEAIVRNLNQRLQS